jgi:multiple sugar transport system substrate-binding protein
VITDKGFLEKPWLKNAPRIKEVMGIDVEVVGVPHGFHHDPIMVDLTTETGHYDLLVYFPEYNGDFAPYVEDLSTYQAEDPEFWKKAYEDLLPTFREMYCTWGGKRIGMTIDGDVHILYYRKDLFNNPEEREAFKKKYGYDLHPPHTWNEWLDVGEFFCRKAGEKLAGETIDYDFYGASEAAGRMHGNIWLDMRLAPLGYHYFDPDTMEPDAKPEYIKAWQNYADSMKNAPGEAIRYGYPEHREIYVKGRCAMVVQWPCIGIASEDPSESKIVGKTGYGIVPGWPVEKQMNPKVDWLECDRGKECYVRHIPTAPIGRIMTISSLSQHKEAAYYVIKWMSQENIALETAMDENGCDPCRLSSFKSPEFRKKWPGADVYLDTCMKTAEIGFPDLMIPGVAEYIDAKVTATHELFGGKKTAEQAQEYLVELWKGITERKGVEQQKKAFQAQVENWKRLGLWEIMVGGK